MKAVVRAREPSAVRAPTPRRGLRAPCAVVLALALGGCSDPPAGPIRLIDLLGEARVETVLAEAAPWETVRAGLGERPYWQPRPDRVAGPALRQTCRATGETGFACLSDGRGYYTAFRVPLQRNGHYRVELRLRSERRRCSQLRLKDSRETRVRRLPAKPGEWQQVTESWRGGARAGWLRIAFRGGCPIQVEGLEVVEVEVGPAEELSLLAAQAVHPFAVDGYGMAKFGSLLPHPRAETVAAPLDENWGLREAILAPAPTDITFPLALPRKARLHLSYALSDLSRPGDRVEFEVLAAVRGTEPRRAWFRRLALTQDSWRWHDEVVDLTPWAGREVDLTLRTRSPSGRGYALWGAPTIDRPRRRGEPPNIVLIAVDTLRADRLSAYGYGKLTTPNLDRLAGDGVLFEYPISQSTQTPPAFASLFTGQIVARHDFLFASSRLPPELPTLARVLRQHGWTTHAVMFHAALYDRSLALGFEHYFNLPRVRHRAEENLRKALDFLAAHGDRRFFLFLHFSDPHQPFTQPPEFVERETAAALAEHGVELPFNLRGSVGECPPCVAEGGVPAEFRRVVRDLYDQEVRYVDDQIGLFLRRLEESGLYRDTLVVFVSDHGETLWDHFDFFDHGGFNQHDELTRVPLIIKPPHGRRYARGAVVRSQVRSFDLMPTILEMAGIDPTVLGMDARSLVPLLGRGEAASEPQDRWAFCNNEQAASVRGRGWKWTWAVRAGDSGEPLEGLYDLARDPGETTNVAAANPRVLRGMRSRYMETLLDSVGGRYLLVLGPDEPARYLIRVRSPGAVKWNRKPIDTLGLERQRGPNRQISNYQGSPLLDGLVLFARLPPAPGPPTVELRRRTSDSGPARLAPVPFDTVTYRPGVVERLLAAAEPGVYLIEAPLRAAAGAAETGSGLDSGQEQALRALGYLQ